MNRVKCSMLVLGGLSALSLSAVPVIPDGSVTIRQDDRRAVLVDYELQNEAAVITVDFQTNGVSLGAAVSLSGDVNRKVAPGSHTLKWLPAKDIGRNLLLDDVKAVVSAWATTTPPPYMAVNLEKTSEPFYYASAEAVPGGVTNDWYRKNWLLMRKIPAASIWWRMGAGPNEKGQADALKAKEAPHMVQLTSDYYIGIFPVTRAQYRAVVGSVPVGQVGRAGTDLEACPVNKVSWQTLRGANAQWPNATHAHTVDAGSVIQLFRDRTGILSLDLPTDAQWEYAGRAGVADGMLNGLNTNAYTWNDPTPLGDYAWYGEKNGNSAGAPNPVGLLLPNRWGLYDMAGNVEEWCLDWYENVGTTTDQVDPEGPASSTEGKRVIRGLGYNNSYTYQRCAISNGAVATQGGATNGFRLMCDAVAK